MAFSMTTSLRTQAMSTSFLDFPAFTSAVVFGFDNRVALNGGHHPHEDDRGSHFTRFKALLAIQSYMVSRKFYPILGFRMKAEYDLSKMQSHKNPYASKLKKSVTIRLG